MASACQYELIRFRVSSSSYETRSSKALKGALLEKHQIKLVRGSRRYQSAGPCLIRCACAFGRGGGHSDRRNLRAGSTNSSPGIRNRSSNTWYPQSGDADDDRGLTQIILLLFLCFFLLSLPWASEHPGVLLVPVLLTMVPGLGPAFMQPVAKEALTWLFTGSTWLYRMVSRSFRRSRPVPLRRQPSVKPRPHSTVDPPVDARSNSKDHHKHHRSVDLMSNLEQLN